MNFAKRLLMVVGIASLAGTVGALLAPKTVHALVATLVQVMNTSANPVPTVATDNPALQPFAASCFVSGAFCALTTVPSGKRLVIEAVSGNIHQPTGGGYIDYSLLSTISGSVSVGHILQTTLDGTSAQTANGYDNWVVDLKSVRLYADPGTEVTVYVLDPAIPYYVNFTISGYLVTAP